MRWVQTRVVDGLELACRATRFVEWLPGWDHIYPHCVLARWSSELDFKWQTGKWPVHDAEGWDAWEKWGDSLSEEQLGSGHWHAW